MLQITDAEKERQLTGLTDLRQRQHELLVTSGMADKLIRAAVPINPKTFTGEIGNKLLFPGRTLLGSMAIGLLYGSFRNLSVSSSGLPSGHEAWRRFIHNHSRATAVWMGLFDPISRQDLSQWYAGVHTDYNDPDAEAIKLDNLKEEGVLSYLIQMLHETAGYRQHNNLSCLDAVTLTNQCYQTDSILTLP